jgi:hypothetical protein
LLIRCLFFGKYPTSPGGGNIGQCHFGRKYEKGKRKRGKCKIRKKGERERKK